MNKNFVNNFYRVKLLIKTFHFEGVMKIKRSVFYEKTHLEL